MEQRVWNWIYDAVSPKKAYFLVFTLLNFVEIMDSFSLFLLGGFSNSFTLHFSLNLCERKEGENVGAV